MKETQVIFFSVFPTKATMAGKPPKQRNTLNVLSSGGSQGGEARGPAGKGRSRAGQRTCAGRDMAPVPAGMGWAGAAAVGLDVG